MFGYVTVNRPEMKVKEFDRYRAFYCGLCHELKKKSLIVVAAASCAVVFLSEQFITFL